MKVNDIISHLSTKLNKAIVNRINEAKEQKAVTPLENDNETYRFLLHLDTGEYESFDNLKIGATSNSNGEFAESVKRDWATSKYVSYINGVVSVIGSTIEGGVNLLTSETDTVPVNASFSVSVEFIVPIEYDNDKYNDNLLSELRTIIDNAMLLNTYSDFDGYNMSTAYKLLGTGDRTSRKGVGESISMFLVIDYAFVEGGINSTQIAIKYGTESSGSIIYAPTKSLTREANQEGDVDLSELNNSAKSVTTATMLTLAFNKPLQRGAFDDAATAWLYGGDTGMAIPISITRIIGGVVRTYEYAMCFNSVSITCKDSLNAALSVVMGEKL